MGEAGDVLGEGGPRGPQEADLVPGRVQGLLQHLGEEGFLQPHQVLLVRDEAHLHVQGEVLVQVAARVVLLHAPHRGHLVDPFKDPHHDLLVKLGGLGEVGPFSK